MLLLLRRLLLPFLLMSRLNSFTINNEFKYIPPTYAVRNPNITSGSVFVLSLTGNDSFLASPDIFHALGTICAMKGYNEGKLQKLFNLNLQVQFNLESFASSLIDGRIGYDFMSLLRSDLVYSSNGSSAALQSYLNQIGVVMGNSIALQFFNYVPFFNELPIPTISYGFAPFSKAYFSSTDFEREFGKRFFYEISAPTGTNFFLAGTQLLRTLNWTLVAPIFSSDDFGYYGEKFLQSIEFTDTDGIQAVCPISIPDFLFLPGAQSALEHFSACIANVDNVSVIWLWMNVASAYGIIKWFRDRGNHKLNFIIYVDKEVELADFADKSLLTNVITLIPFVGPVIKAAFDSCIADLNDQSYISQLGKFVDQCMNNGTGTFPLCNLNFPPDVCTCNQTLSTYYKTNLDLFAFAFDGVSLVANAISLMQNNCSFLNEFLNEGDKPGATDFCTLTEFDPTILGKALRAANFLGLSGPVTFIPEWPIRQTTNMFVKQISSNFTSIVIGLYINGVLKLNTSRMTFKTIPISEIVVQIPDLSYWFVAVFFGITCFLIAVDFLIWAIITLYRNDQYIKRRSPFFMALITVGILQVLISNILLSIGLTSSAMCILTNFFLLSGVAFIVANILAKNYRVYRIFSNVKAKALKMNDSSLFLFPLVIVGVTWIMWAVTSFADGPIKVVVDSGADNPFYVYGLCRVTSQWFQDFQVIFWYVYFISLFLLAGLLGFLTRNVNHVFNESVNVTIVAFAYIAYAIIFAPLYYIQSNTTNNNNTRVAIQALAVCILSAMTMALLHLPTLWNFYKIKRKMRQRH